MKKEINIALVEDHPLTRLGLTAALKPHRHIHVMFEAANGRELLDHLKTQIPDIILLDIEMPVMKAQEVLERIKSRFPKIKVIIISAFFIEAYIIESFKLGAKAFLPKGAPVEKTLEAINEVHENGIYTDSEVSKILASELQNPHKYLNIKLSAKELEIIRMICSGLSRQQAADEQEMTIDGLNYHMRNIMRKTNTKTKKELVAYAQKNGLTSPGVF